MKELIKGEIYYEKGTTTDFIAQHGLNDTPYYIAIHKSTYNTNGLPIEKHKVVRLATSKEKHWLNECIKPINLFHLIN